jgi:tetratricopeptide (TPR) repeat protein
MIMSAAAALLIAFLAPTVADDDALVEAINEAYEAGDYARAIDLLDQAHARDPRPAYLYSKGEILVAADDCPGAIAAFEAFLATDPPAIDAAATREKIERCEPPRPEPPPPVVETPTPAPPRTTARPRRIARDPAFIGLVTAGAGLAVTGAALLVAARFTADATSDASTQDAWDAGFGRTRGLAIGGTVVVSVGGGLLLGAVVRAIVIARANKRARSRSAHSRSRNAASIVSFQ